jgi:hypothetical protein
MPTFSPLVALDVKNRHIKAVCGPVGWWCLPCIDGLLPKKESK